MKQYTIYNYNEITNDLELETIFYNREEASKYLLTTKNNIARYTTKYNDKIDMYDLKLNKYNKTCIIDIIDNEE